MCKGVGAKVWGSQGRSPVGWGSGCLRLTLWSWMVAGGHDLLHPLTQTRIHLVQLLPVLVVSSLVVSSSLVCLCGCCHSSVSWSPRTGFTDRPVPSTQGPH